MTFPARYCTGYLGDVGTPSPYDPMDFGVVRGVCRRQRAHTFDREEQRAAHRARPDRAVCDATDVAISNAFGPNTLVGFKVWVDEINQLNERRIS